MEFEKVPIRTTYISLGQFIKLLNIFESGGIIKHFLQEEGVLVNGVLEHRRGRKLYENDKVEINGEGYLIVKEENEG